MNQYPLWKNLLIVAVIIIGIIYAVPNLFGDDPAIQVSAGRQATLDLQTVDRIESVLKAADLAFKGATLEDSRLLIRFNDADTQLAAQELLQELLADENYIIALNLASSTPNWLLSLGAKPMNLGLDLRGGVHFLMEVDMDTVLKQTLDGYADDVRALLRRENIRYTRVDNKEGTLSFVFRSVEDRNNAERLISREINEVTVGSNNDADTPAVLIRMTDADIREIQTLTVQQNVTTLRNRINELGVAEPTVQQQGSNRIVVQLPGVQDTAQAKGILGATATLEFRLVDFQNDVQDALRGRVPPNSEIFYHRDGRPYLLQKRVMLTGEHIINAQSNLDSQTGAPMVSVTLDGQGARLFSSVTGQNVGNPMSVLFIESNSEVQVIAGEEVRVRTQQPEIISVATIRDQLGKRFQITGLDSMDEAHNLALLLRAGALAAPIDIIEERTVGPSLGQENIERGFKSIMFGFVFSFLFMAVWYRVFGMVANIALAANLVLLIALLSMLQATLTMPGIAGIVLTVGMAVDANVLIFERIREELLAGNSSQASINVGYDKAFATIADANITTLIAAIVLFGFGTGSIKGFAVTLCLGLLTSMFTAIMGTRAIVNLIYGRKHRPKLSI